MSRGVKQDDDASQYWGLVQRLERLERASIPEPIRFVGDPGQPGFLSSPVWSNLDAAAPPTGRAAGFYKHAGRVYLMGVVKGGTSNTVAFTLPSDYLPYYTGGQTAWIASASGGVCQIVVDASGNVFPISLTGNVNLFAFLDGSFRAR